jgi:hypothetical protein
VLRVGERDRLHWTVRRQRHVHADQVHARVQPGAGDPLQLTLLLVGQPFTVSEQHDDSPWLDPLIVGHAHRTQRGLSLSHRLGVHSPDVTGQIGE